MSNPTKRKMVLIIIAVLAGVMTPKTSAINLTLSDEGLMALDEYSRHVAGLNATILDRRDIDGAGVIFDIYFPSNESPGHSIYYFFSEDRLKEMLEGVDAGSYDAFELKFTLVSVDGSDSPESGGFLVVGAHVGGAYRPESITLREGTQRSAVSTTRIDTERISSVGFTAHMLTTRGWDPNGTTVTLLIEPGLDDVAIPQGKEDRRAKPEGKVIYVDSSASGANNGSSWVDAFKYLQDGLAQASEGDEIWAAEGVYKPDQGQNKNAGDRTASFVLKKGVGVHGGFPSGGGALEDIGRQVRITTLSGDLLGNDSKEIVPAKLLGDATRGDNSYHVVSASGTDSQTLLAGCVITGGNAIGAPQSGYDKGGGLYSKSANLTLSNCVFKGNSGMFGGGMCSLMGDPLLINCTFLLNYAHDSGGAMNNSRSNPVLYNCVFGSNLAKEKGGGVYNGHNSPIKINCTFSGNAAYAGGGIYCEKSRPVITNCILWGNRSRYGMLEPSQIYAVEADINYCCIQGLTEELGGDGNIGVEPGFVNAAANNFHLNAGSACIDAGMNDALPSEIGTDVDGTPRLRDGNSDGTTTIDIGAQEF